VKGVQIKRAGKHKHNTANGKGKATMQTARQATNNTERKQPNKPKQITDNFLEAV
jgi:hypothetical protein